MMYIMQELLQKGLRRVPTFVNLKSNTMKNIAKILILRHIAKFLRVFLALLLSKYSIFLIYVNSACVFQRYIA